VGLITRVLVRDMNAVLGNRYLEHPIALEPLPGYSHQMMKPMLNLLPPSASACAARSFTPVFAFCGALGLLLVGCATEPESHLVSAPPPPHTQTSTVITTTTTPGAVAPAYVTTSPATPVVSTIVVTTAPPAPQQEVVLAQPSSQHVWIAGYWTWRNDRYEWMAGHWELPPNSGAVWVAPRWEQEGNAYRFHEGYWQ
jgi:hypothetical protein